MNNLVYEKLNKENLEDCKELCNELMEFQKSKAIYNKEAFDYMNFDTRMKPSYDNALRKEVIAVKDNNKIVAYIFSTIDEISKYDLEKLPSWAPKGDDFLGFYPDFITFPQKIGCLNNLYIKDQYKNMKIGSKLCDMSLKWFKSFSDVSYIFVFVSNGNEDAFNFYKKQGFIYSHEVFGGFIKAMYKKIK